MAILSLVFAIVRRHILITREIESHAKTLRKKRMEEDAKQLTDMIAKTKEIEELQRKAELDHDNQLKMPNFSDKRNKLQTELKFVKTMQNFARGKEF